MNLDRPIIVAGGGIGGLTAALAMHRNGVPVAVYERRTEEDILGAPGSGLTVWSNAATPLGWLGLTKQLLARSQQIHAIHSYDAKGRPRFLLSTNKHIHPGALPSLSIGRFDLADILMSACRDRGIEVNYGVGVTGYQTAPDHVVVATTDQPVVGAALVGADGVRSAVLGQLHGRIPERYIGRTTYRGVAQGAKDLPPGVPQLFRDDASGIGGGVYPIADDRAAWTLSVRAPAGERDEPGQQQARAMELARVMPAAIRDRVARTSDEAIIRTDIWYHEWHQHWGEGLVTLLGDAAHAMPNDLGQGACQAIEDAVVLADALAARDFSTPGQLPAALRDYEQRRFDRVKWVRAQSVQVATAPEPTNVLLRWMMRQLARAYLSLAEKPMWRTMQRVPELTAADTPLAAAAQSREA
ncbi:FAD-dependent monooxygenase [Natronosporangium hydrolyticum]|uniref:FAD-dependent monooxygenase n=1 Tax=Natronosporangium hydrolyticum TaxID=2811111 RepID=A0A895YCT0_9ACTN|nr:NAD(P)/FAD-dependent oxidoreductase [Natronosporangium hydrolyticum]QSB13992.1 FAD-dependent monooxygenase [Natronosporangium hydrolyticum]